MTNRFASCCTGAKRVGIEQPLFGVENRACTFSRRVGCQEMKSGVNCKIRVELGSLFGCHAVSMYSLGGGALTNLASRR